MMMSALWVALLPTRGTSVVAPPYVNVIPVLSDRICTAVTVSASTARRDAVGTETRFTFQVCARHGFQRATTCVPLPRWM